MKKKPHNLRNKRPLLCCLAPGIAGSGLLTTEETKKNPNLFFAYRAAGSHPIPLFSRVGCTRCSLFTPQQPSVASQPLEIERTAGNRTKKHQMMGNPFRSVCATARGSPKREKRVGRRRVHGTGAKAIPAPGPGVFVTVCLCVCASVRRAYITSILCRPEPVADDNLWMINAVLSGQVLRLPRRALRCVRHSPTAARANRLPFGWGGRTFQWQASRPARYPSSAVVVEFERVIAKTAIRDG